MSRMSCLCVARVRMSHPYLDALRCPGCLKVFSRHRQLRRHQYFEHRLLPSDVQLPLKTQTFRSSTGSGVERAPVPSDGSTDKALALNALVPFIPADVRELPSSLSPSESLLRSRRVKFVDLL
jgi:hypothetical protein